MKGDRVVVSVPMGQELAAKRMMYLLEQRGVTAVELRHEQFSLATNNTNRKMISKIPSSALSLSSSMQQQQQQLSNSNNNNSLDNNSNINSSNNINCNMSSKSAFMNEDLEPLRIFQNYMTSVYKYDLNALKHDIVNDTSVESSNNNTSTLTNDNIHSIVMKEGMQLIEKLSNNINSATASSSSSLNSAMKVNNLRFDNVILSNFGPYAGERRVNYPLSKRGLVLLRGQSSDGTGADSNGSGKVILMHPMNLQLLINFNYVHVYT